MADVAGVILTGGKSSRMGTDKADLRYKGTSLREHMHNILHQAGLKHVYISGAGGIADEITACGPLGGVHATLRTLGSAHTHFLYVPVDMPQLSPSLLRRCISTAHEYEGVRFAEYMLPFRLTSHPHYTTMIEGMLAEGTRSLHAFQQQLPVMKLNVQPEEETYFVNVNTPEAWAELTERAS